MRLKDLKDLLDNFMTCGYKYKSESRIGGKLGKKANISVEILAKKHYDYGRI